MNEVAIFNNPEFGDVRTVTIDGEPWFVATDVCRCLDVGNSRQALTRLDEDEKNTVILNDGIRGNPEKSIINEPGLYTLALSSRKPEAKAFKRWITHEVVPAIRKHGAYMTPETIDRVLSDPDTIIRLATQLKEERAKRAALETTVAVQHQQIQELTPKASYYDIVLNCKDAVTTTVVAKDYGWSATRLNRFLHEQRVQYKQGDTWVLYQKYAERGFTNTRTHTYTGNNGEVHSSVQTRWTQKGRLFIYELMGRNGFVPVVEREQEAG